MEKLHYTVNWMKIILNEKIYIQSVQQNKQLIVI